MWRCGEVGRQTGRCGCAGAACVGCLWCVERECGWLWFVCCCKTELTQPGAMRQGVGSTALLAATTPTSHRVTTGSEGAEGRMQLSRHTSCLHSHFLHQHTTTTPSTPHNADAIILERCAPRSATPPTTALTLAGVQCQVCTCQRSQQHSTACSSTAHSVRLHVCCCGREHASDNQRQVSVFGCGVRVC